jgi:hypothetical protein
MQLCADDVVQLMYCIVNPTPVVRIPVTFTTHPQDHLEQSAVPLVPLVTSGPL